MQIRRIYLLIQLLLVALTATAQQDSIEVTRPTMAMVSDTVVVIDLETGLPLRDVKFFTNTGEMRQTDYRGRFVLPDSTFQSATLTHGKYLNRVLERYEITDTLEMLPSASSLGDVVVWGKDRRLILSMVASATENLAAYAPPKAMVNFDFFKLFLFCNSSLLLSRKVSRMSPYIYLPDILLHAMLLCYHFLCGNDILSESPKCPGSAQCVSGEELRYENSDNHRLLYFPDRRSCECDPGP